MASSTSNRTALIDAEAIQRVQNILESDEFYSTFPEKEYIEVIEQFELIFDYLKRLIEKKVSPIYQSAMNLLLVLDRKLTELKIAHNRGEVTNADMLWTHVIAGREVTASVKALIKTIFGDGIVKLVLNRKEYINELGSGWKCLPPHPLIANTIQIRFPSSKQWLMLIFSPDWEKDQKVEVAPGKFIKLTERPLISLKSIKNKQDAEKWMTKINSLEGFNKAVSIRNKNGSWFLDINFPDRLEKKLKRLGETKDGNLNKILSYAVANCESVYKNTQPIRFFTSETIHIATKNENPDNPVRSQADYDCMSNTVRRIGFWPVEKIHDQVQEEARKRVLANFDSCSRSP